MQPNIVDDRLNILLDVHGAFWRRDLATPCPYPGCVGLAREADHRTFTFRLLDQPAIEPSQSDQKQDKASESFTVPYSAHSDSLPVRQKRARSTDQHGQ